MSRQAADTVSIHARVFGVFQLKDNTVVCSFVFLLTLRAQPPKTDAEESVVSDTGRSRSAQDDAFHANDISFNPSPYGKMLMAVDDTLLRLVVALVWACCAETL